MLTRDETIMAFRAILGRDPADEDEIQRHFREHSSLRELGAYLLSSLNVLSIGRELTPADAFEIIYGRSPDDSELRKLNENVAKIGANGATEILRVAITSFDRRDYPTPIQIRFGPRDLKRITIANSNKRLVLDEQDFAISSTIIAEADYEGHLTRFMRLVIQPGMTCVDIGANVGFHALIMADLVGESGRVYAIEPNSENCRMLMLSAAENASNNISILPVALSDEIGASAFSPAIGSNGNFLSLFGATGDPLLHPNCTIVPTFPLDMIIDPDRLDFIKIDVEGAEALALSGARRLIEKHHPVITSEFSVDMLEKVSSISGEAFIQRLISLGYRAFTIDGRRGPLEEIVDPAIFMAKWPGRYHIADLGFVPVEHPFDFAHFVGDGMRVELTS